MVCFFLKNIDIIFIYLRIGILFAQGLMSWRIPFLTERNYLFIQIAQIFISCVMRGLSVFVGTYFLYFAIELASKYILRGFKKLHCWKISVHIFPTFFF